MLEASTRWRTLIIPSVGFTIYLMLSFAQLLLRFDYPGLWKLLRDRLDYVDDEWRLEHRDLFDANCYIYSEWAQQMLEHSRTAFHSVFIYGPFLILICLWISILIKIQSLRKIHSAANQARAIRFQ